MIPTLLTFAAISGIFAGSLAVRDQRRKRQQRDRIARALQLHRAFHADRLAVHMAAAERKGAMQ